MCVVPAGEIEATGRVGTPGHVASSGGLAGVTDDRGIYHIRQAPSGTYEIIVVLEPKRFPASTYRIRASGIPFRAAGPKAAAPLLELTADTTTLAPANRTRR